LLLQKRIGQIAEGDNAWLKLVHIDGKIHGGVNTNGTVTGRCSFIAPNMGQVPRVGNPYGKECRSCFTASPGWLLVGCDASGIQLRLLAHLLSQYDNGEYINVVTTGDVHECNRQAAGLLTRDQAKTFIYALLFGAGAKKIASIVGRSPGEGKQLLNTFLSAIPAFRRLNNDIGKIVTLRSALTGLDRRRHPVRSAHLGLSVLLQSYEAVIMKTATVDLHKQLSQQGLIHGKDYKQVLHLYDENQFEVPNTKIGLIVGVQQVESITNAGELYKIKCPLTGSFKIGKNWAETH
jgi:DNA polymerase I-like protein with 3'-5' exonuclease and polymerase domains